MSTDLEVYELLEDFKVPEWALTYLDLEYQQRGEQTLLSGSQFIKIRKQKDILFCLPWPSSFLKEEVEYRGQVEIPITKLQQAGTVTEEEMGLSENRLASSFAKALKLKRLLPKGPVEISYKEYSSMQRLILEQGVGVSSNGWCGKYTVQGPPQFSGKRRGISVSNIDYSTMCLISVEEALTCDNEHVREQAVDEEGAFKAKVSNGIDNCYSDAYRGLAQLQRLIERLANGNKMIPSQVGRISRAARQAGKKKAEELAEELGIVEKHQTLLKAFEKLQKRAKVEVAEVVAKKLSKRNSK